MTDCPNPQCWDGRIDYPRLGHPTLIDQVECPWPGHRAPETLDYSDYYERDPRFTRTDV